MSFQQALSTGQLGESLIAQWLRNKGYNVLPAYEKEIDNGKGPRLFTATGNERTQLISPDLFVMGRGRFFWVEAKHKTRFSWYGVGRYFVTGVDLKHFHDYCRVADSTEIPVYLLFLHRETETWSTDVEKWGAPLECPVGLFGKDIDFLRNNRSHESPRYGTDGMIYWRPFIHLQRMAMLSDVMPAIRELV